MADETPSDLKGCSEEVPLLGVTREFDFGQFIELFDDTPDPNHPNDPPTVSRIVIQPNSQLASDRNAARASSSAASTGVSAGAPPLPASGPYIVGSVGAGPRNIEPEVHLFDLTEHGPGAKLPATPVEVSNAKALFEEGKVQVDGRAHKVDLDDSSRDALTMGMDVTTFASPANGQGAKIPVRLSLPFQPVKMTESGLAAVLAGKPVDAAAGKVQPALTPDAIRTLLSGGTVLTHGLGADGLKTPLSLQPPASKAEPISDRLEVFDLPSFISSPSVMSKSGERLPVSLTTENIQQLLSQGKTRLQAGGRDIDLTVVQDDTLSTIGVTRIDEIAVGALAGVKLPGMTRDEVIALGKKLQRDPHFGRPVQTDRPESGVTVAGSSGGGVLTATAQNLIDKVQPRLPTGTGLHVAVFVPWKQTWSLKGFSRGNLLQTVAMAPLEEVTMQVFSWERRSRTLEQSSETDVDQQTDVNQTTRDTEDVFKEMISKHDFAWQISGSIDASYSPGVASIRVSAAGGVSETNNIVQTARRSSQSVKEMTVKASSRVRSRRVTRVTQSVETGREERVTRSLRNPNQTHTLTLDFFETLAHYEIKLQFLKDRLRLVVLVPNPINVPDFVSEIVRKNETALRNALIDSALVDGFEACKFVAAYEEAKKIIAVQTAEAAKISEVETQRDKATPVASPDPAAPQQAELERVVGEMISIMKAMKTAEIDTALRAIANHAPVQETARRSGQQWLFVNFCSAKMPSLLSTLDDLITANVPPLTAAQKMIAVLPKPDAPTNLGNLNQMSNADKEGCGIASKLKEERGGRRLYQQMEWDWGWWTTRMGQEALYTANDGGLAGLADQLQKAWVAWEAKKAQGSAMKDQEVAKTEAEGKQEKASTDDKLSMAFPLDELARAHERMKVLMSHLNDHRPFYNYALFQALPPSEQSLQIVLASNGKLQVGLFEPRVVAMSGTRLVVPLTPLASSSQLQAFVSALADQLDAAFSGALNTPDSTILPTPGLSMSSRLGKCSCGETYIEKAREHELSRLEAVARQERAEAARREARLELKNFEEFRQPPPAVKLELEQK